MNHLINRLQFEIQCSEEEQAFLLRHHVSSVVQDELASAVDKVCSAQIADNEIVQIDRLEIDLGTFTMHSFHTDFASVFTDKLERQLKKFVSKAETKETTLLTLSDSELLFHFLLNGDLPWWANEKEVNPDAVAQHLALTQPTTFTSFLHQQKQNTRVWKRITWQLNHETKTAILLLVNALLATQELFNEWSELVIGGATDKIVTDVLSQKQVSQDLLLLNAPLIMAYPESKDLLAKMYISYLEQVFEGDIKQKGTALGIFLKTAEIDSFETATLGSIESPTESSEQLSTTEPQVEIKEKYILKNAGIVLLSPFFKPLFERLQLLDQKQWVNVNAQYKAVHVLAFLGNGNTNRPEYGLVLEKMLCGMTPIEPIPPAEPFTEKEKEEIESVLLSAIEHWKALKNTSIHGFRETFLKREGILTPNPNGWLVQVERKTVDVLLDSIPWGYTTITSSWNAYFIFVEW